MNKIATVIMALSLCLSASASVIIRGTIDSESGSKISLYAITQNFDSLCATGQADANGRFVLKPTLPYNGFYVLANELGLKHGIYLKDGKQLTVKYSNERLEVTGGLSAEEKTSPLGLPRVLRPFCTLISSITFRAVRLSILLSLHKK